MSRSTFFTIITITMCIMGIIAWLIVITFSPDQSNKHSLALEQEHVITTSLKQTTQDASASITIKDLTLKELEKGKEFELIVNAKECKFLHTSDMVECAQVTCTLLDHKAPSAQLKTDKAFINRTQKNIFFAGKVFGNMKGLVIQSSNIRYDFSQQTLKTGNSTKYEHPDFYLTAQQSFIDLKNNHIHLSGGVINEFYLEKNNP